MGWSEEEVSIMTDMGSELHRYWIMEVDNEIVNNCRTKKHNQDGSLCITCIDVVETIDPNGIEWVEIHENEYSRVSEYLENYPRK